MLADVLDLLVCPHCGSDLDFGGTESALLCERGHCFDVARQGYVSLLAGSAKKITGDSADMLSARADFLGSGHFDPIVDAVSGAVAAAGEVGTLLEVGAGSGRYLSSVLERTGARGIGVDVSKAAAKRVARAHPRIGSVVADIWQGLPVRSGSLAAVTCVFSPRNAPELRRVLEPAGVLVVATPTGRHQRELIDALGLIGVDEDKARRLGDSLGGKFEQIDRVPVEFTMNLRRREVESLVAMGPSARHATEGSRRASIELLPDVVDVTASVIVGTYRAL